MLRLSAAFLAFLVHSRPPLSFLIASRFYNKPRSGMDNLSFFRTETPGSMRHGQGVPSLQQSTDMAAILLQTPPKSLVILDIDDTIGRVPQAIGLDPWFRARVSQYASEGHESSIALDKAIWVYNLAQLRSTKMVPVDQHCDIAGLISQLKSTDRKVMAITARNDVLTEKTLELLDTLHVSFSEGVINENELVIDDKKVYIKAGVIFANGCHKGRCLEHASRQGFFTVPLEFYSSITFVDDSEKNCKAVAESLAALNMSKYSVWHYTFAETNLPFTQQDSLRAAIQERFLLEKDTLLNDEEADAELVSANGLVV